MRKLIVIFLLFTLCLFVYNLNLTTIGAGDTIPSRLSPFNIFLGDGLYFDKFYHFLKEKNSQEDLYYFQKSGNHYISSYPLISGFLSIPIYSLPYVYMSFNNLLTENEIFRWSFYLEKLSASFLSSISVILFYLIIFELSKKVYISLLFSLIFAFATQTFSISSQALWQHTSANFFLILSQLIFVKGLENTKKSKLYFIVSLLFAIFTFWSRLYFIFYLFIVLITLYLYDKKNISLYLILPLFGILLLVSYNLYFYGSAVGGYDMLLKDKPKGDFINGFLGLMFSPARGTLFYTPFFIFSLLSIKYLNFIKSLKERIIYFHSISFFIFIIFINSFWGVWWGGHSFGDRLLTDIAPQAVVLSYIFYKYNKVEILKILLLVSILYSIFIQILGVLVFPKTGWNTTPSNIDYDKKRLWDFYDSPITRSLKILSK